MLCIDATQEEEEEEEDLHLEPANKTVQMCQG